MTPNRKPITVADVLAAAFKIKAPPPCPTCHGVRLKGPFSAELYCVSPDCPDYWEKVRARRVS